MKDSFLFGKCPRWVKNAVVIVLVVIASFGTALYADSRFYMLWEEPAAMVSDQVTYVNYREDGDARVSVNEDPQILLSGVDGAVSGVRVRFEEPLSEEWTVQLYYAPRGMNFSEKNSRFFRVSAGSGEVVLPMEGAASSIRLDIGNAPGIRIRLSEIEVLPGKGSFDAFQEILSSEIFWVRFELLLVVFGFLGLHALLNRKKLYEFIYRYRWLVGLALILFLTANKIHGDSIAAYDTYVQTGTGSEFVQPLFGQARAIRTDEWVCDTGKRLSSRFLDDPYGKYSDIIRGTKTVNPLYVGVGNAGKLGYTAFGIFYRILGIEYGYYFDWNASTILTLLFTFEFFLILTRRKKLLSLLGTSLVVFSSFHLWWGIPSFLLYLHAIVVFFYYFFTTENRKLKILCAVGEPVAVANFISIFYPAWQVPAGYMLLAFLIWLLHENWAAVKSQKKETWFLFGAALALCALLVVSYVCSVTDRLDGMLTAVYPGQRMSAGGNGSLKPFYYFQAFFYPFRDIGNPSEAGTFCSLFPLPLLAAAVYTVKAKRRNWLISGLLLTGTVFLAYAYLGFPMWLSRITLLSYSFSERALDMVSLINVYLLVLLLHEKEERGWNLKWPVGIAISGAVVVLGVCVCRWYFPGYMPGLYVLFTAGLLVLFGLTLLGRLRRRVYRGILIAVIVFSCVSGISVRPFQRGLDAIDSKPLAGKIREIDEADPGRKWVAVSENFMLPAYAIACGAPTINSLNDYPNLELWNVLDPEGRYNEVYNRYAHVIVEFTEEETSFELLHTDRIKLCLSYEDLDVAEVKYIVSDRRLETEHPSVSFEELYGEAGAYVYQVKAD
ncbi:MAG: hypothetical protein HFI64_02850 [Lachnospiraceae bacterium]|nr:hypothetical protein [Lachnospiraceae bacterium]